MNKQHFTIDAENFQLVRGDVGIGKIKELPDEDAGLLAPHIDGHLDTLYVASSGVNLAGEIGVFDSGQQQVAIEWVRHETKPRPGEPECNTYRFLFGLTKEGRCIGLDVTQRPVKGQVADHWTTFDDAVRRHFPDS